MKRKFEPLSVWTTAFCGQTAAFEHLSQIYGFQQWQEFPSCEQLNRLLGGQVSTLSGYQVRFCKQDQFFDFAGRAYETYIYQTGLVPTRVNSWHDTFGALIWCLFPKSKALLNHLHQQIIERCGLQRDRVRDALTLFDECGVILAFSDGSFKKQLRNHQWLNSMYHRREEWGNSIGAFNFGHANYERLTKAYIGLTGKAFFVAVDQAFFSLSLTEQYAHLDQQLVDNVLNNYCFNDNSQLSPLPLLGIPGWWASDQCLSFYKNEKYFRCKKC